MKGEISVAACVAALALSASTRAAASDPVVIGIIEANKGSLVKTIGDAVMAVFARELDAVLDGSIGPFECHRFELDDLRAAPGLDAAEGIRSKVVDDRLPHVQHDGRRLSDERVRGGDRVLG